MSKDPSPLLGYNNNIRHKNRVFHVQTEDSGIRHPHIITHLFMDGGRILKSVKTSYADQVGAEKMGEVVRQMMKEQHKAMLMALRDGQYDHLVEAGTGKEGDAGKAAAKAVPKEARIEAPKARARSVPPPPKIPTVPPPPTIITTAPDSEPPATDRNPNPPEELTLDIEALERAAAESTSPLFQPGGDLPPPPANLFRERGTGGGSYRTVSPAPADRVRPPTKTPPASRARVASSRPPPPLPRRAPTPRPPPPTAAAKSAPRPPARPRTVPPSTGPTSEGRYAPARPAAIFGQSKPKGGNSIFGDELISDKSLDEVILSYLAEDLETGADGRKKK